MNKKILYTIWLSYLVCYVSYIINSELVVLYGISTTLMQCLTAFFASLEFRKVYLKTKNKDFMFFSMTLLFLSLSDFAYGLLVNIKMAGNLSNTSSELYYSIPYTVFWILSSWNIFKITSNLSKRFKFIHYSVFVIVLAAFFYGYLPMFSSVNTLGFNKSLDFIGFFAKFYIVTASVFLFLSSRLYYVQYLSAGYFFIIIYSLLLEYLSYTNNILPGLPSEIFWSIGTVFLFKSAESVQKDSESIMQGKLIDMNSIRTRIILLGVSFQLLGIVGWVSFDKILSSLGASKLGLLVLWVCVMVPLFWLFSLRASRIIIRPLELIREKLTTLSDVKKDDSFIRTGITEYDDILSDADKLVRQIREQHIGFKRLSDLAAQMSHDIRSPLTALRLLSTQNVNASEKYKMMMDQVVSRIHNIADNLLAARKGEVFEEKQLCMPFIIVESILAEKKISCRSDIKIEFIHIGEAKLSVANFSKEKLEAIISNIVNNALDAFDLNKNISNPTVSVFISCHETIVKISIQDNAGGIHPDVVNKINNNLSVSTKKQGNGIGLLSARKELESSGGRLDLISELGFGAIFEITIPLLKQDDIFSLNIVGSQNTQFVSIDDDYSIQILWKEKLGDSRSLTLFSDPDQFATEFKDIPENAVYLIDYEFRKSPRVGIDIIEFIQKPKQCYLVTSRYYEKAIVDKAKIMGFKIIPKPLSHFVEIKDVSR